MTRDVPRGTSIVGISGWDFIRPIRLPSATWPAAGSTFRGVGQWAGCSQRQCRVHQITVTWPHGSGLHSTQWESFSILLRSRRVHRGMILMLRYFGIVGVVVNGPRMWQPRSAVMTCWVPGVHTNYRHTDGENRLWINTRVASVSVYPLCRGSIVNNMHMYVQGHYGDVIMGAIASQITSLTIVYSTVYSDADQRKHQSSASLAFVRGIHRGPVNSPHKWPVTRKMFPFDDVIMFLLVEFRTGHHGYQRHMKFT